MRLIFRQERPEDYRTAEEVTREAFWNHYAPGCDEHYLVHILRDSEAFIKELDIVAEADHQIVGNIMYSKAQILKEDGTKKEVICFGPVSVLPEFQGRGIGSGLIVHTRRLAAELGYRAVLIYGDPGFYGKLGFLPAENYRIATPDFMYADALQAFELQEGALFDSGGRFFEAPVFEIDQKKAREFDRGFPKKEKQKHLPSQERFLQIAGMRKPVNGD